MGEAVVTRQIQCSQCGAAHQVLDDALLVLCEYCGAFVAIQAGRHWGGDAIARQHARSLRAMVEPTRADARKTEAQRAMEMAHTAGDRSTWRLWAREYYTLLPTTDPQLLPGNPEDARHVARWVQQSVAAAELTTFDPQLQEAQGRYAATMGALYRDPDPVAVASRALAAAEALYRALFEHPDYPQTFASGDPAHMARELLRSSLVGVATVLGPGVVGEIRQRVLGDEAVAGKALVCRSCGGPLPATAGTQRCPHCGAVIEFDAEDPWVADMLGLWKASRHQAEDDAAEAMLTVTLGLSSYFMRKQLVPVESMLRLLTRGPHWLSRESLQQTMEIMRAGYDSDPAVVAWLSRLSAALGDWVPRGVRPLPPAPRPVTPPDAPLEDPRQDPWVRQALVLWERSRSSQAQNAENLPMTVLGLVLHPFYLGGSISTAQALAFIEAVEPRPERAALADAADLMRQANVAPAADPLLADLAATLRLSPG